MKLLNTSQNLFCIKEYEDSELKFETKPFSSSLSQGFNEPSETL